MLYYLGDVRFPKEFRVLIAHIASLVAPGGRILMSNFISVNRPESIFSGYVLDFLSSGLVIEHKKTFQDGKKRWVQVVLKK